MRIAWLVLLAGCGASKAPPVAPSLRPHPCESAHWEELAQGRMRVWPKDANGPATIVEVAGAHVEVASVTPKVIATRWLPYASLSMIAMQTTTVSSERRAGDSAVRILVGHPLDPPRYGWSAVHDPEGFVPGTYAGTMWTVDPVDADAHEVRRFLRQVTGDIRMEPADDARVRIALTTPTIVEILAGAPNDYLTVTVHLPFAEIDGFWKRPPPEPPSDSAEIDVGSPAIHSPIAPGTCLYDAPHGRVVGMIRDADAFTSPIATKTAGWYAATIPTIWGPSTYYIDSPPLAPPATQPDDDFDWNQQWTNEW